MRALPELATHHGQSGRPAHSALTTTKQGACTSHGEGYPQALSFPAQSIVQLHRLRHTAEAEDAPGVRNITRSSTATLIPGKIRAADLQRHPGSVLRVQGCIWPFLFTACKLSERCQRLSMR